MADPNAADLSPIPLPALMRRMFSELENKGSIFDLPKKKFFLGDAENDYSVTFHGQESSSPLGPAAGPHTQMAQNIVLSWLVGCRIMELKTIQLNDELVLPRPCIDMATIGFNVEWSQELKIEQSLEEYVKASMLIEMLIKSGKLDVKEDFQSTIYDISVGYDLAGIQSPRVQWFIKGMMDASEEIERLRAQIPEEYADFKGMEFSTKLSKTLTLSTFHGCPPEEIESIIESLLKDNDLNCTIKLNPTLLGPVALREILHDTLGYDNVSVPDSAFESDATWEQATGFVDRLGKLADSLGLGFGVKFSNTLIVHNDREFFPKEEKMMYLSGTALHVLSMHLVNRFRGHFGDRFPISFSAGIDRNNFSDAVAIGLTPITTCSDLLKTGGYGRAQRYFGELKRRMQKVGAAHIDDYIIRAYDNAEEALSQLSLSDNITTTLKEALAKGENLLAATLGLGMAEDVMLEIYSNWRSATLVLNTAQYVATATEDPRYNKLKNDKPPKKVGTYLNTFDCLTCDKCVYVCPNDAIFRFDLSKRSLEVPKVVQVDGAWKNTDETTTLNIVKKHQIAVFNDVCNECGNCDVFCPEYGKPYVAKPHVFGTLARWKAFSSLDGFFFEGDMEVGKVFARIDAKEYEAGFNARGLNSFKGEGFSLKFLEDNLTDSMEGEASEGVDMSPYYTMKWIMEGMADAGRLNHPGSL